MNFTLGLEALSEEIDDGELEANRAMVFEGSLDEGSAVVTFSAEVSNEGQDVDAIVRFSLSGLGANQTLEVPITLPAGGSATADRRVALLRRHRGGPSPATSRLSVSALCTPKIHFRKKAFSSGSMMRKLTNVTLR